MLRNRVWLLAAILTLSISLPGIAPAWEFTMDGTFTWKYEYITQTGTAGFFGPYDFDAAGNATALPSGIVATTALGAPNNVSTFNGWLGQRAGNQMVSGADYSRNSQYMNTNIDLKINPALRIRGVYYVGSWANVTGSAYSLGQGDLVASEYINYRSSGVQRSFSPGYWNTLWLTAQLPWGTLTLGKRPSIWGMGLAWNGVENRSSEQLTLSTDYGPLRIQAGFYPSRRSAQDPGLTVQNTTATGAGGNIGAAAADDYYNPQWDKNNIRVYDFTFPNVTYRSGPLDMGVQFNYVLHHRGNERLTTARSATSWRQSRDRYDFYGGAYVKYFNGRFFFNSEFDWNYRTDRLSNAFAAGTTTSITRAAAPIFTEGYRMAAETGVICGPSKVSLLYAWLGGTDRRGNGTAGTTNTGTQGINQGTFNDPFSGIYQSTSTSNTGMFRPYSYLMVYNYGLGAFFNSDTLNGYADDASIMAGRLDYAVAANLNVYGSFMWADRVGNGYGWGYLQPLPAALPVVGGTIPVGTVLGQYRGLPGGVRPPTIPDNNLGWEIDAGFDWKLLEGFTCNFTMGYWQPGKWFNFATVDKTNPNWRNPTADAVFFGTNPTKTIDPILGLELNLVGEF